MAEFELRIDASADLTVMTIVGDVTAAEIGDEIRRYYEGPITQKVLWDFRQASLADIRADQVRGLVRLAQGYDDRRPSGKTALLFGNASGFGMGRMFDIPRNMGTGAISHMSFMDEASAYAWLEATA